MMRFFSHPDNHLLQQITKHLSLTDALRLLSTNRSLRSIGANPHFFMHLLHHDILIELVNDEYLSIQSALELTHLFSLPDSEKRKFFLTEAQQAQMHEDYIINLVSDFGIIFLQQKLITPEQVASFPTSDHSLSLFTYYGFIAMFNQWITPEWVAGIEQQRLSFLFSDRGIEALSKKLICASDVASMQSLRLFGALISSEGLAAMKAGRITPAIAAECSTPQALLSLIRSGGIK